MNQDDTDNTNDRFDELNISQLIVCRESFSAYIRGAKECLDIMIEIYKDTEALYSKKIKRIQKLINEQQKIEDNDS